MFGSLMFGLVVVAAWFMKAQSSTSPCSRLPQCVCTTLEIHCTSNLSAIPIIRARFQRYLFVGYPSLERRLKARLRPRPLASLTFNGVRFVESKTFFEMPPVHSVELVVENQFRMEKSALFGLTANRFEIKGKMFGLTAQAFSGCSIQTLIIIRYNRSGDLFEDSANHAFMASPPPKIKFLIIQQTLSSALTNRTFPRFESVQYIRLTNSSVESVDSYVFAQMPNLNEIDLSHNRIESVSAFAFAGANSLTKLTLTGNPIKSFSSIGVPSQMLIMFETNHQLCTVAAFPLDSPVSLGYESECSCPVFILHNRYGRSRFLDLAPICYRNMSVDQIENEVPACLNQLNDCRTNDDYQYEADYQDSVVYEDYGATECSEEPNPSEAQTTTTAKLSTACTQCKTNEPIHTALTATYIILAISVALNFLLIFKFTRKYP